MQQIFDYHTASSRTGCIGIMLGLLLAAGIAPINAIAQQSVGVPRPVFIENKGQWDRQAKFLLRTPGLDLWITGNGVVYDLYRVESADRDHEEKERSSPGIVQMKEPTSLIASKRTVMRAPVFVTYEGGGSASFALGSGRQQAYHNYYIGSDRSKWADHVGLYSGVRVQGLYSGIDAVYYLDNGRPRYDLVVAPGADPAIIHMRVEGASKVSVGARGELLIATALGTLEQRELFAYQESGNGKQQVACRFVVQGDGSVRLRVGDYDRSRPLVVDPLVYSTYLGGSAEDRGTAIAADSNGNAIVTGFTYSTNFPTLNPMQGNSAGGSDAFVARFSSSGSYAYSTYIGSPTGDDGALGVAVDASGNAYVTGYAVAGFPMLNPMQGIHKGGRDVFVTRLTATGVLSYSTFLGGMSTDEGRGIAVDDSGNMFTAGITSSQDIPNATGPSNHSGFVAGLTSGGALSFMKYLGPSLHCVAVDDTSNVYVAGTTPNDNSGIAENVFVAKLTSGGDSVYFMTVGGSDQNDGAEGIAVDEGGNAYITGTTRSSTFPTHNALQSFYAGDYDAFVMKLTPAGTVAYSTFLGGNNQEFGHAVTVDRSGNAFVTGSIGTTSISYTTPNAEQPTNSGASDMFVARLTPNGGMTYFTFLGGPGHDIPNGIALAGGDRVLLTGYTANPTNFPIVNAAQNSFGGGNADGFVTMIQLAPISRSPLNSDAGRYTFRSAAAPNPFTSTTTISFTLPGGGAPTVVIYDVLGREVAALLDDAADAGAHTVIWDGTTTAGVRVPAGEYFYRIELDGVSEIGAIRLIR